MNIRIAWEGVGVGCTQLLIGVFALNLVIGVCCQSSVIGKLEASGSLRQLLGNNFQTGEQKDGTYGSAGHLVVGGLASDLEGDIVRGVGLDLESASREVVEVLVEELENGCSMVS